MMCVIVLMAGAMANTFSSSHSGGGWSCQIINTKVTIRGSYISLIKGLINGLTIVRKMYPITMSPVMSSGIESMGRPILPMNPNTMEDTSEITHNFRLTRRKTTWFPATGSMVVRSLTAVTPGHSLITL